MERNWLIFHTRPPTFGVESQIARDYNNIIVIMGKRRLAILIVIVCNGVDWWWVFYGDEGCFNLLIGIGDEEEGK